MRENRHAFEHFLRLLADDAIKEAHDAAKRFEPLNSYHEAYGVLLEELDELWEEIKTRRASPEAIEREATQVASVAIRIAVMARKESNQVATSGLPAGHIESKEHKLAMLIEEVRDFTLKYPLEEPRLTALFAKWHNGVVNAMGEKVWWEDALAIAEECRVIRRRVGPAAPLGYHDLLRRSKSLDEPRNSS